MIVANVSPSSVCAQETLSTLYFARRAKHIRNRATVNVDVRGDVALLQREIQRCAPLLLAPRSLPRPSRLPAQCWTGRPNLGPALCSCPFTPHPLAT
jgi:hypothetical protein